MEESTSSIYRRIEGMTSILHHENERHTSGHKEKEEEANLAGDAAPAVSPEVKDNMADLTAAIALANDYLKDHDSPYRFGISLNGGDIMLEILFTDAAGLEQRVVKKDITHEDFIRLLDHVTGGGGLVYDSRI